MDEIRRQDRKIFLRELRRTSTLIGMVLSVMIAGGIWSAAERPPVLGLCLLLVGPLTLTLAAYNRCSPVLAAWVEGTATKTLPRDNTIENTTRGPRDRKKFIPIPTLYEAYRTAVEGEPGPVFVEIPVDVQTAVVESGSLSLFRGHPTRPPLDMAAIEEAAHMLVNARQPGLLVGWGARYASEALQALSTHLAAPVATTLQGLSVFPANHPLHTGMGFGPSAVPAAQHAFADCDCLLAIATRFSEIATGHYGLTPPDNLIHADINPKVFNANYPATHFCN